MHQNAAARPDSGDDGLHCLRHAGEPPGVRELSQGGTQKATSRVFSVVATLDQQPGERRRKIERGGERLYLSWTGPRHDSPAQHRWRKDAHPGECISFGSSHADPLDSEGYRIAPQASHPSMIVPALIWLRRFSGTAV